jgi:MFS family permease
MTPFRSPSFRHLWWSTILASGALGMERTITAWLALELGAGPLAIGFIFAARMLPSLLLGLVAGTIADRADRRLQLLAVGAASLAMLLAFGGLVAAGLVGVWLVAGFSFIAGCLHVFDTPARQALVLDTAGPDAPVRALALNAVAGRFAPALGALAVGAMIPLVGVAGSYLATAGLFGLAALFVVALRAPQDHRARLEPPPFRQALHDAARLMLDVPVVRTLVLAGLACEVFAFSHLSALPLFAQEVLAAGPAGLGALNAAASVGGALAVTVLALLPERLPRQPLLGAVFLAYGLAIAALAASRSLALAVAVLVITGCCAGAFDVLQQTLLQLAVPAGQRGRAVGLWVLSIGSAPLGHLQMGLLIAALGVPVALLSNGLLTVAAAVALLAWAPAYRGLLGAGRRGPR